MMLKDIKVETYIGLKEIQMMYGCGKNKADAIFQAARTYHNGYNPNFKRKVKLSAVIELLEKN